MFGSDCLSLFASLVRAMMRKLPALLHGVSHGDEARKYWLNFFN